MLVGDNADEEYLDDPIKLFGFRSKDFHSYKDESKTLVVDDSDDEYLEDPIKLLNIRPTDSHWNEDIKPAVADNNKNKNFDIYQIQFDKYILSDKKKLTTLPPSFSRIEKNIDLLNECRPVKVTIVDCNQFPWYYKNYNQHNDTYDNNEEDDVIIIDYEENSGKSINIESDYGNTNIDPVFSNDNSNRPQYKYYLENVNRKEITLNDMKVEANTDLCISKYLYRLHSLNENKGKNIEDIIQKVYCDLESSHNMQLSKIRHTDKKNKGSYTSRSPMKPLNGVYKKCICTGKGNRQNDITCPIENRLNANAKNSNGMAQESLKNLYVERAMKNIDIHNKFYGSGDNIYTNKISKQFVTTNSLQKNPDMLHNITTPCIKPTINNKQYQVCNNPCLHTPNNILPHFHNFKMFENNQHLDLNLNNTPKNMSVVNNTNRKSEKKDEIIKSPVVCLKSITNYQNLFNNNYVNNGSEEIFSEVNNNNPINPKSAENINFMPSNPYSTFMKPSMPYRSNQSILKNYHNIPVIIYNNNSEDIRPVDGNLFRRSNMNVHNQNNMLDTNLTSNVRFTFENVSKGQTITENSNPILKTILKTPSQLPPFGQDKTSSVSNLYVNEKSNNICKIQSVLSGVTDIENYLNSSLKSSSLPTSNCLPENTPIAQISSYQNAQPLKPTISTNLPHPELSETSLISTRLNTSGQSVKGTKRIIASTMILPACNETNDKGSGFNKPYHACMPFPTFSKPQSSSQPIKLSSSSVTKMDAKNPKDISTFGYRIPTSILLPVGGYSPPILPITPYQKTLEIFEKNVDAELRLQPRVCKTKLSQNHIWNPKQGKFKRKSVDAANMIKKISFEEYKKRPLENMYNQSL